MTDQNQPQVERRRGVDVVHYFWIPYAVVIVLLIIGLAWSGTAEERIRVNTGILRGYTTQFAEVQHQITNELAAECEYDTKIQAALIATAASGTVKKAFIGSPPFCKTLPQVSVAPSATP